MDPVQFKGREPAEIKAAQEKKKEEEKKTPPIKVKKYYDVKLEAMVPCMISYRILAFDEHEALTLLPKAVPNNVKHNLHQKRNIKIMIYDSGSSILRFVKNLVR